MFRNNTMSNLKNTNNNNNNINNSNAIGKKSGALAKTKAKQAADDIGVGLKDKNTPKPTTDSKRRDSPRSMLSYSTSSSSTSSSTLSNSVPAAAKPSGIPSLKEPKIQPRMQKPLTTTPKIKSAVTECSQCGAKRQNMSWLFCQDCGTRF